MLTIAITEEAIIEAVAGVGLATQLGYGPQFEQLPAE